jgi:hypothetical protein
MPGVLARHGPDSTTDSVVSRRILKAIYEIVEDIVSSPGGWFNCKVLKVGVKNDGEVIVSLRDTSNKFPARWFGTAPTTTGRETLAQCLTVIASPQLSAWVMLSTTDEWGRIQELHVTAPDG